MKHKLLSILSAIALVLTCFSLTSCYVSKPGYMRDLVGTYQLTKYNYTPQKKENEEEATTIEKVKDEEIVAYLVINENGDGYYVYKSKTVALRVESVKISFTYDDEKPDKVREIKYSNGISTDSSTPGTGCESLGLYFKAFEKTLNMDHPAIFNRKYSTAVTYKKVSKAKDLSYVAKKLGVAQGDLVARSIIYNRLDGIYEKSIVSSQEEYKYFLVNIRGNVADLYYQTNNGQPEEQKNVNLTFTESSNKLEIKASTFITLNRDINNNKVDTFLYSLGQNSEKEYFYLTGETIEETLARVQQSE